MSDWSSDVCSSDLPHRDFGGGAAHIIERADLGADRPGVEGARHGSCPSLAGSAIWVMPGAAALSSTRLSTDRKMVVEGRSVSGRVEPGGGRIIKQKLT